MLTIYALAALPFFTGGQVVTLAISGCHHRSTLSTRRIDRAAASCLILFPCSIGWARPASCFRRLGFDCGRAAVCARPPAAIAAIAASCSSRRSPASSAGGGLTSSTPGTSGRPHLFSKWNSFSRIGVYERHGDGSLSPPQGPLPGTRFMNIDSAASTPILHLASDLSNAYLRTSSRRWPIWGAWHRAVIAGGGRDLASALVFAHRASIASDQPDHRRHGDARSFLILRPSPTRVRIEVDDGRNFVRRTPETLRRDSGVAGRHVGGNRRGGVR
jgi:hypothetical protein